MTLKIERIQIKNFRSIRDLSLEPADLAVLVGRNDSGKSNVLRAINLFFNNKTTKDEEIDFALDHSLFNHPNRRAKEIIIQLQIRPPENYRRVNGDQIFWEKRWRAEGLVHDEYVGRRKVEGPRGGVRWEDLTIPDKSNLHTLLRNIRYIYIPAIKDISYFSELRASIYNVISDVAGREFLDSSSDFESSISRQLSDLTSEIASSLGLQSRLALPRDLSHIFESLDFLSENHNISLDARGDGIKARHIPLILKFMADKKRSLQGRGAQPYNFIWGYEEPENSLELSSSIALADQFLTFVSNSITQIFITTHSPIFYNLHSRQLSSAISVSCHHIYRDSDEDGTKQAENLTDLDERMGTTALIAPLLKDIEESVRRKERARAAVETLAAANRRKVFVEGPSDKLFFDKAFAVFAGDRAEEIDVVTQTSGGINYVIDMLLSWRSRGKHHSGQLRAAGLLDSDSAAKKAANNWNSAPGNVDSAKCFKLPSPPHLLPALKQGFPVPIVLECLYNPQAWNWAEQQGYLGNRDLTGILPAALSSQILSGLTTLDEQLHRDWAVFIKKQFIPRTKTIMARHFANKPDDEFRALFQFLEPLIEDVVAYLFPASNAIEYTNL